MVILKVPFNHGGVLLPTGTKINIDKLTEQSLVNSGNAEYEGDLNLSSESQLAQDAGGEINEVVSDAPKEIEDLGDKYTFETLMLKRSDDLKQIAKNLDLPTNGSKETLANLILEAQSK